MTDTCSFPSLPSAHSALPETSPPVLILATSPCRRPLQAIPSLPCCQSDLITVRSGGSFSNLEPSLGFHPLEDQAQTP